MEEQTAIPDFTRVDEPLPYTIMGEYVNEQYLTEEIDNLWANRESYVRAINNQKVDMRSMDATLSEMLYTMKAVLSKPGRGGGWSAWLKKRSIPRATADRLVARYAHSVNPDKRLNESIPDEPTETELGKLASGVWGRVESKLPTGRSRYNFIRCLVGLAGVGYQYTESGVLLQDPDHVGEHESQPAAPAPDMATATAAPESAPMSEVL